MPTPGEGQALIKMTSRCGAARYATKAVSSKLHELLLLTPSQPPACRAIHPADLLSSKGVWPGTADRIPFVQGLEGTNHHVRSINVARVSSRC